MKTDWIETLKTSIGFAIGIGCIVYSLHLNFEAHSIGNVINLNKDSVYFLVLGLAICISCYLLQITLEKVECYVCHEKIKRDSLRCKHCSTLFYVSYEDCFVSTKAHLKKYGIDYDGIIVKALASVIFTVCALLLNLVGILFIDIYDLWNSYLPFKSFVFQRFELDYIQFMYMFVIENHGLLYAIFYVFAMVYIFIFLWQILSSLYQAITNKRENCWGKEKINDEDTYKIKEEYSEGEFLNILIHGGYNIEEVKFGEDSSMLWTARLTNEQVVNAYRDYALSAGKTGLSIKLFTKRFYELALTAKEKRLARKLYAIANNLIENHGPFVGTIDEMKAVKNYAHNIGKLDEILGYFISEDVYYENRNVIGDILGRDIERITDVYMDKKIVMPS